MAFLPKPRRTLAMVVAGFFLLAALVGGGIIVKRQSDRQVEEAARYERDKAELQSRVDKLMQDLKDDQGRMAQAEAALTNAQDDAARSEAQRRLLEAQNQAAATKRQISNAQRQGDGQSPSH